MLSDGVSDFTPGVSSRTGGVTSYRLSGIKNAERQVSSSHVVTGERSYGAFGSVLSQSGWTGPFGYGGDYGYQEDPSGLMLLGHRYYDSSTGRFLTRDPIHDGTNWYAYCAGDPMNFVDPEGLQGVSIMGLEFTAAGVGNGLRTGAGAVLETFSLGLYRDHYARSQPGYGEARVLAEIGKTALTLATSPSSSSAAVLRLGKGAGQAGQRVFVYRIVKAGIVKYVGVTNNPRRRELEHGERLDVYRMPRMNRAQARNVEQVLINRYGLGKNGGTLRNKIDSISNKSPDYLRRIRDGERRLGG